MTHRPPRSTRTYTLFPYPTLFRSLEQGDSEAFGLEAAGAVERLFGVDVADDLVLPQGPEAHRGGVQRGESPAVRPHERDRRATRHRAAGHRSQLGHR